ncbi:MAG: hypothetical protein JWO57_3611, partial [Pseudonocardiales bacterium]|nr:hypothetical protein [Pseudonocardiales bacterium]
LAPNVWPHAFRRLCVKSTLTNGG